MKNKTQKQTRILTIQSDISYGMRYLFKEVPKLRLTGLWLVNAGFKPGQIVKVEIEPNKLILKPETDGNT
jgi:hypothetical protein